MDTCNTSSTTQLRSTAGRSAVMPAPRLASGALRAAALSGVVTLNHPNPLKSCLPVNEGSPFPAFTQLDPLDMLQLGRAAALRPATIAGRCPARPPVRCDYGECHDVQCARRRLGRSIGLHDSRDGTHDRGTRQGQRTQPRMRGEYVSVDAAGARQRKQPAFSVRTASRQRRPRRRAGSPRTPASCSLLLLLLLLRVSQTRLAAICNARARQRRLNRRRFPPAILAAALLRTRSRRWRARRRRHHLALLCPSETHSDPYESQPASQTTHRPPPTQLTAATRKLKTTACTHTPMKTTPPSPFWV